MSNCARNLKRLQKNVRYINFLNERVKFKEQKKSKKKIFSKRKGNKICYKLGELLKPANGKQRRRRLLDKALGVYKSRWNYVGNYLATGKRHLPLAPSINHYQH